MSNRIARGSLNPTGKPWPEPTYRGFLTFEDGPLKGQTLRLTARTFYTMGAPWLSLEAEIATRASRAREAKS